MVKLRVDQYERAGRAWLILIDCARNRKSITYGQLAARMDVHPRVCRFFLGLIQDRCMANNLPPLQSLVVNMRSRLPGGGYIATPRDHRKIEQAHTEVFKFEWDGIVNPF